MSFSPTDVRIVICAYWLGFRALIQPVLWKAAPSWAFLTYTYTYIHTPLFQSIWNRTTVCLLVCFSSMFGSYKALPNSEEGRMDDMICNSFFSVANANFPSVQFYGAAFAQTHAHIHTFECSFQRELKYIWKFPQRLT